MLSFRLLPTYLLLGALCLSSLFAQDENPPETLIERASYAMGHTMGQNLKAQGVDVHVDLLMRGLKDALAGEQLLSEEQLAAALAELQQSLLASAATRHAAEAAEFLASNGARPEVLTTESGLQYELLEQGDGLIPQASDRVVVHYQGSLLDGTVFDSSYERGSPLTLPVSDFVPGTREALQLLPVGSKFKLYLPAALGYGEQGYGQRIPPQALLIYEMELLQIED